MKHQEIEAIENALEVSLPEKYRKWCIGLPRVNHETESWQWAFNDFEVIIEANRELRNNGCQGHAWPKELFCIGEADGNHYFIALNDEKADVHYTNRDDGPYFSTQEWRRCFYQRWPEFSKEDENHSA